MNQFKKKMYSFLCFFICLITISNSLAQEPGSSSKSTLAVLSYADFIPDRTGIQNGQLIGMPDVLAGRLIENLTNTQRFNVVERKALRRIVTGQRFGKNMQKNYLDKSLDKAIGEMEKMWGGEVNTTAAWSDHNDIVKDFQDLGSMTGADFLILGNLEKNKSSNKSTAIPYSKSNKQLLKKMADVRLRLRIINVKTGMIKGAASIHTKLSEALLQGMESKNDSFTVYDKLAKLASAKILDITYPAKIVSLDPLIISRGSNDGAKSGDTYIVQREGKEIKDSNGLVLARLKQKVGSVKVINAQNTIAIVNIISGNNFQLGDLAELEIKGEANVNVQTQSSVPINKSNTNSSTTKKTPTLAMGKFTLNSSLKPSKTFTLGHLKRISDGVINNLSNSKRFIMLERHEVDQILDEKIFETIAAGGELSSRLSQLEGADYLIHGELNNFYINIERKKIPYVNEYQTSAKTYAEGIFRIVDVYKGSIISAEKIRISHKVKRIKDTTQATSDLIDQFVNESAAKIILRLFPIKVMGSSADGTVYLNRGLDAGIKEGMMYQVMRAGQALIDPDTGEPFGNVEDKIATITITSVEERRSRAQLQSGRPPKNGDILKVMKKNTRKSVQRVMQPNW